MSTKPRFQLTIRYLIVLFAATAFCAAGIGYAAGTKTTPKLVLEPCGQR